MKRKQKLVMDEMLGILEKKAGPGLLTSEEFIELLQGLIEELDVRCDAAKEELKEQRDRERR